MNTVETNYYSKEMEKIKYSSIPLWNCVNNKSIWKNSKSGTKINFVNWPDVQGGKISMFY